MQRLTKEQAVVISAYTSFLVCDFADMHTEIERRLGSPIFTHQLANRKLYDEVIRPLFKADFVAMCPAKATGKEGE